MKPLTHIIAGAILTATIGCGASNQLEMGENYALVTPTQSKNNSKKITFNLRQKVTKKRNGKYFCIRYEDKNDNGSYDKGTDMLFLLQRYSFKRGEFYTQK